MSTTAAVDVRYPIYRVKAEWLEDDAHPEFRAGRESSFAYRGVPEGRRRNSTSQYLMLRERLNAAGEAEEKARWWERALSEMSERGKACVNVSDFTLTITHVRDDVWCPSWFSHWAFDVGQTDAEALRSFQEYVDRIEDYNREHSEDMGTYWIDAVPLMGAEDRGRWTARATGTSIIGHGDETGPPPCRCEHCKAAGILRIDH